ncbi:cytochrome P450 [Streptomyces canus]|uniref:cytochrome P450 n=1 Tax=Streptomyces canus TaxID=58343 RepID=UPI003400504F
MSLTDAPRPAAVPARGECPVLHGAGPGRTNADEVARLRAHGPAPQVELPGGVIARVVLSHRLTQLLSSSPHVSRNWKASGPADDNKVTVPWYWAWTVEPAGSNALNSDGDKHRRLRAPLVVALARKRVDAMEPVIKEIVRAALEDLADGPSTVDLVPAFALRVPHQVVIRLLGMPAELLPDFRASAAGLFDTEATNEQMVRSMQGIRDVLAELVTLRREHPGGDDLVSDLIREADAGENPLTDIELRDQLLLVITAGIETTVHAIGTLLVDLLTHPEALHLVLHRKVAVADAVEESLRRNSAAAAVPMRYMVEDFTDPVTGLTLHRGERVILHLAAAGTDPEVHEDPGTFDITRATSRQHLAFGHGPHFCPGAALARLEIATAVGEFIRRFPATRLTDSPLQPVESFIVTGYGSIPVQLAR